MNIRTGAGKRRAYRWIGSPERTPFRYAFLRAEFRAGRRFWPFVHVSLWDGDNLIRYSRESYRGRFLDLGPWRFGIGW